MKSLEELHALKIMTLKMQDNLMSKIERKMLCLEQQKEMVMKVNDGTSLCYKSMNLRYKLVLA